MTSQSITFLESDQAAASQAYAAAHELLNAALRAKLGTMAVDAAWDNYKAHQDTYDQATAALITARKAAAAF
jgi:hypothetical protein